MIILHEFALVFEVAFFVAVLCAIPIVVFIIKSTSVVHGVHVTSGVAKLLQA